MKIEFDQTKVGDIFTWGSETYIRMEDLVNSDERLRNAVNLNTGETWEFYLTDKVRPINIKLVVID